MASSHHDAIRAEFTKQSAGFEDARYVFGDREVLDWILRHVPHGADDVVLEVAAGTAQVGRALAPEVAHVVAIDLTPAMLATGKAAVDEAGVRNVVFQVGDAAQLPFLDACFHRVVCRFAVHHFDDPAPPVAEMVRTCRPGGTVSIIDLVEPDEATAGRANHLERLRDPTHVRALLPAELRRLVEATGARVVDTDTIVRPLSVDRWLSQAATPAEAARAIVVALEAELDGGEATGMAPGRDADGGLVFHQTWQVLTAVVP